MKYIPRILLMIATSLLTINCSSYTVTKYHANANTIEMIRLTLGNKKISFGKFEGKGNEFEYMCRAAGPIKAPGNMTFSDYIRNAFIEEFKMAGNYSENSNTLLNATITELDFDSMSGAWDIKITLRAKNGKDLLIYNVYEFSSSFFAESGCRETSNAFVEAVSNLIYQTVSNPSFKVLTEN